MSTFNYSLTKQKGRPVKVKLSLCLDNYAPRHENVWGVNVQLHSFLTSAGGGDWSALRPGRLPVESAPSTHWRGDWRISIFTNVVHILVTKV